jgi:hypothetical protein
VYEPGRRARYYPSVPHELYEEAYWDDLNAWLAAEESRIQWRFPSPARADTREETTTNDEEIILRRGIFVEKYAMHIPGGIERLKRFFDGKTKKSGETRECVQFQVPGRYGYYYVDRVIEYFRSSGEWSELGWPE